MAAARPTDASPASARNRDAIAWRLPLTLLRRFWNPSFWHSSGEMEIRVDAQFLRTLCSCAAALLLSCRASTGVRHRDRTLVWGRSATDRPVDLECIPTAIVLPVLRAFHLGAFISSASCLSASASSALIAGLSHRGSVLCRAATIARVTGIGAQPWSVSHTRSHCGRAAM